MTPMPSSTTTNPTKRKMEVSTRHPPLYRSQIMHVPIPKLLQDVLSNGKKSQRDDFPEAYPPQHAKIAVLLIQTKLTPPSSPSVRSASMLHQTSKKESWPRTCGSL